ncbi:MAG TPA: SDR family NAD(P)-dependent oxidoreductase [Solirubrobacteraceae bacterium]|jgi:short-subunit dehydrogenase|nr:SDR family NAD(P)-dependent oxidoreductase [Solirubrobacteraceae bacterium]
MPVGSQLVQISGSTVLLTGASGGLGQAIARAMRARGAELVLTGRRVEVLEPLAAELGGRSLEADLGDPVALERLLDDAGRVDILIANAALPATGRLETYSIEQIDRSLEVNLRAPIVLARALLPAMLERASGHLLFMSSLSGKAATPSSSMYNAAKFGLRGFAAALRADLRGNGVGVSTIFPGFIRDAGFFADAGVKLPPGVGTRSPEDVARACVSAIERNRGEVDVAPLPLRLGTAVAGLAPELSASVSRRLGSDGIAREMAAAQADKR